MERKTFVHVVTRAFVGTMIMALGPLAAEVPRTITPLPAVQIGAPAGSERVSLRVDRLAPGARVELELPPGLGEANGLERHWVPSLEPAEAGVKRWTLRGRAEPSSTDLDLTGLEPGERALLSTFATDPRTGDELQAHWWLVASDEGIAVRPAGAARLRKMIRLTLDPEAGDLWNDLPRDDRGRIVLRQTDPQLAELLPYAVVQEPSISAQSITAAEANGQITASTDFDMDFTPYVCEYWTGLILQVNSAPADAVITTFDVSYTVYHSVDTSRYKSSVSRWTSPVTWLNTISLYNGSYSGHHWHSPTRAGLPDWAGYPVNRGGATEGYVLGVCNLYGQESAYLDKWSITLYYTTGGGGGGTVDLVADDVRTDFDTIAVGGQLGYYYDAHVGGSGAVGSGFQTGVYLSNDAGISTSDRLLENISEDASLSAGEQFGARMFSRTVNIPGSVSPGTYWVGVVVDNGNNVSETNEGNNTAAKQITIVGSASKPNLKVTGCSVSPTQVSSGGTVQLSYHAQNAGATGAAYFSWETFISTDSVFDGSDQAVEGLDVPGGWAAGYDAGTQTSSISLAGLANGAYYVGFMLDVGNQVPETNESDNYCVAQVTVGSPASNVDLVADSVSTGSGTVVPGGQIGLNYEAHVGGSGSVGGAFTTGVYLSSDAGISTSDRLLKNITEPSSLSAGNQFGARITPVQITIPADVTPGTYWIGVFLDKSNAIAETSENNNTASHQITVGSGGGGGVTRWLIPGSASVSGLNNANWKTQISIVNPDSSAHTVDLYYVPKGQAWPGVVLNGNIQLSPGQAWFRDDPLAALRPTSGMMYVVADSPGPVVTTRTYNDVSGVGRYGQGIAAEPIGASCVSELILPMVHSGLNQYHTNLGLVEADSGSFTFEVTIYSPGGTVLATKSFTRSGGFDQITDIFANMGLGNTVVTGGWIRVKLTSGCPAHWTTYASVIDESTGDPTYVAPVAP